MPDLLTNREQVRIGIDHDDLTEADLVAWGKEQFQFMDELPMTSTGKILKRELSQ